ncbi:MAG: cysteine desulfurase [Bacteroidetes bacterium]|nr:cysteine desulfurase [Bacteroidota bacterium]
MSKTLEQTIPVFDVSRIRKDFPLLDVKVHGKPLVYLDNGATAQKPQQVIDAITTYYAAQNANVHRGVHTLSQEATVLYDAARNCVQKQLNAASAHEIIFTKGTTDGINLLAATFENNFIRSGDEVIISEMEHHSNIVPWQILCEKVGAELKVIPINDAGELIQDAYQTLFTPKTKLVAITHVSNTLGSINPVKEMIAFAHERGALVCLDGAQAVPHMKVDVQDLDCDFYVYSAHKLFGPTGMGVLYGKEKWLTKLPPYQSGGGMIKTVSFQKTEYADLPHKFEAGTPHIEGAIGLAAAIQYVEELGYANIQKHEHELLVYATEKLSAINAVRIIGTAAHKAAVVSFVVEGTHPFDVGTLLDKMGIAVRTGHHCNQPLMQRFGIPGTVRASFAFYNSIEEVDALVEGVKKAIKMLL